MTTETRDAILGRTTLNRQELAAFLASLEDDTEEAPWMVMGDAQFWSASGFAHSLRIYAREQERPWYVAAMLPILYRRWPGQRKGQVAPDTFVAFVAQRARMSYDVEREGAFPAFVLEVVSPSSVVRDVEGKTTLYEAQGAQEYALFNPDDAITPLRGYRRGADNLFEEWPLEGGRLYSAVLDLWLTVTDEQGQRLVQAVTPQGRLLLTPAQAEAARLQAEQRAQDAKEQVARLRAELEQLRGTEEGRTRQ